MPSTLSLAVRCSSCIGNKIVRKSSSQGVVAFVKSKCRTEIFRSCPNRVRPGQQSVLGTKEVVRAFLTVRSEYH